MKNLETILLKVDYDDSSSLLIEKAETTTNNKVLGRHKRQELNMCPICGWNSGCNRWRRHGRRSWKKHRKNQWKVKS